MSDGQVTGANDVIIQKDYKKFKKISDKQIIAFAGAKEICEQMINQLPYTSLKYNLSNIANQILAIIQEERFNDFNLFFGLAGIDIDNEVSLILITNKDGISFTRPTPDSDISYITLNPSEKVDINEKIIGVLSETGFNTPNKCLKAQKRLNDYMADNDPKVNKRIFELTIKI